MISDTPRTDAYVAELIRNNRAADSLEHFARNLERELAAEAKYREALFARLTRYEVPPTMLEAGCWPDRGVATLSRCDTYDATPRNRALKKAEQALLRTKTTPP